MSMLNNKNLKVVERQNHKPKLILTNYGKTKAQQHTKDQCDINVIMKKFKRTGRLPLRETVPIYDDFSTSQDFHTSMDIIIKAENQFSNLPALARKKFDNDPAKFLEFCNNPKNHKEMVELGLAKHVKGDHNMDGVVNSEDNPKSTTKKVNDAPETETSN